MTGRITPLYVVCSPCRGVGKTLVSRLLTEFHVIDDRPVAAFDLADEGPQLADYLPELTTIADIGETRGQMAFFDRLIAEQDATKIIDLGHRTFKDFFTIVRTIDFFEEARRRSIEPLILFVIAPDPKSPKAYAMLRRWFPAASLMPVRSQAAATPIPHANEFPNASMVPVLLDIPVLGSFLKTLVDQRSFSISRFWRTAADAFPVPPDDELRIWMEHVFLQFRDLELWLTGEETSPQVGAMGSGLHRATRPPQRPGGNSECDVGAAAAMNRGFIDTPKQVLEFAPKKKLRIDSDPMDHSGRAIVAMLQKAADLSHDDCARVQTMADQLSHQLRAAEDRINQLETEVEHFQDRAVRAESWLQLIHQEIEENLAPTQPSQRPEKDQAAN
jgi:hypothetical protein